MQGSHVARGDVQPRDTRPWIQIGALAVAEDALVERRSAEAIALAIQSQRSMVQSIARAQHKALRPFKSLQLAWEDELVLPTDSSELILGSYRCPDCGAFNEAASRACLSCGSSRPDNIPTGLLTLAVAPARSRPLDRSAYAFCGTLG